jgi:hypothetical protein
MFLTTVSQMWNRNILPKVCTKNRKVHLKFFLGFHERKISYQQRYLWSSTDVCKICCSPGDITGHQHPICILHYTSLMYVRFQFLMTANMMMTAFWDIAPCLLVEADWWFRGTYCLLLHHHHHHHIWIIGLRQQDYMTLYPRRLSTFFDTASLKAATTKYC